MRGGGTGLRLICSGGVGHNGNPAACPAGQNCSQADGQCYPSFRSATAKTPGTTYCGTGADAGYEAEYTLYTCGPDLVTANRCRHMLGNMRERQRAWTRFAATGGSSGRAVR